MAFQGSFNNITLSEDATLTVLAILAFTLGFVKKPNVFAFTTPLSSSTNLTRSVISAQVKAATSGWGSRHSRDFGVQFLPNRLVGDRVHEPFWFRCCAGGGGKHVVCADSIGGARAFGPPPVPHGCASSPSTGGRACGHGLTGRGSPPGPVAGRA